MISSHKRQYSAGVRDYDIFGNRSLSSNRSDINIDRPQTSNNRDSIRRDVSADAFLTKSHNFDANAPSTNGKRNPRFFNPSFTSDNVFYDHNYGYKHDMPNERLLTPVKNDRFAKQYNDGSRTPNRGDRTPNRGDVTPGRAGDRTPERGDRTPTRNNLAPTTPTRTNNFQFTPTKYERYEPNQERFSRTQNFEPQQRLYNEESAPKRTSMRDSTPVREEIFAGPGGHSRKNSSISQNEPAPLTPNRRKPEETARFFGRSERPGAPELNHEADNIRDDRSEASTVISTLSSAGYVCPKCFNRHVSDCKQAKSDVEKQQARNSERNLAVLNRQFLQDEEEKKKQARARRVEETRDLKDKLNQDYLEKQNKKRWPTKEEVTTFDGIFNRQEDHKQLQKALGESFRVHLKDQIRHQESEKEKERHNNSMPYGTSLPVGEGYRNKYLDSPENMRATLKDQVEEKLYNNRRQQEEDKRVAQRKNEEALRSLDDDNQFKKNKEMSQRQELKDAYTRSLEEKEAQKRNNATRKTLEKHFADSSYNQFKAKQQEADAKFKLQLNAFKQGLAKQVESASYRKIYEDKKNLQGNGTSFGPQKQTKKVYQCGECPEFFEKKYLTKLK